MAQFESMLVKGDVVDVTYAPAGASVFSVVARPGG
jgi:hypothetical protein